MNKELLIKAVVAARGLPVCTVKQLTSMMEETIPPVSVLVRQCHAIGALNKVGMRNGAAVYTVSDNAIQLIKSACDDEVEGIHDYGMNDMAGMMKVVEKANVKGMGSDKLKMLDELLKGVRK